MALPYPLNSYIFCPTATSLISCKMTPYLTRLYPYGHTGLLDLPQINSTHLCLRTLVPEAFFTWYIFPQKSTKLNPLLPSGFGSNITLSYGLFWSPYTILQHHLLHPETPSFQLASFILYIFFSKTLYVCLEKRDTFFSPLYYLYLYNKLHQNFAA